VEKEEFAAFVKSIDPKMTVPTRQSLTYKYVWKRLLDVLSVGLEYFLALALALNTKSLKTSLHKNEKK